MESFYGGHAGTSFTLRQAFASVAEMTQKFKQGRAYDGVWFGEYCIIATENLNNAENGRVYRRGVNYNGEYGGAEFIGQFVGPSSGTPNFYIDTLDNTKTSFNTERDTALNGKDLITSYENLDATYAYKVDNKTQGVDPDNDYVFKANESPDIQSFIPSAGLVSGKEHGSIDLTWYNKRKNGNNTDSEFNLGLQFPYPVVEVTGESVSPYDVQGNIRTNDDFIVYTDDTTKKDDALPFYYPYIAKTARGIKGDSVRNFRIANVVVEKIEAGKNNYYLKTNDTYLLDFNKIAKDKDLFYSTVDTTKADTDTDAYDADNEGCLDYNKFFTNADDTTGLSTAALSCRYIYELDQEISAQTIKVLIAELYLYDKKRNPKAISICLGIERDIEEMSEDDGYVTITYTDGTSFSFQLEYVKDMNIDAETGQVSITKANGPAEDSVIQKNKLTWVKDITLDKNGVITLHKTTENTEVDQPIRWIDDVTSNKATGIITVTYNTKTGDVKDTDTLELTYPVKVALSDNITENKKIKITYTNSTSTAGEPIGDPINSIADSFIGADWYLYTLYTAPEKRPVFTNLYIEGTTLAIGSDKTLANKTTIEIMPNSTGDALVKCGSAQALLNDLLSTSEPGQEEKKANPTILYGQWCIQSGDITDIFGNTHPAHKDESGNAIPLYWKKTGPIKDTKGVTYGYLLTNKRANLVGGDSYPLTNNGDSDDERFIEGGNYYKISTVLKYLNTYHQNGLSVENSGLSKLGLSETLTNEIVAGKLVYYTPQYGSNSEVYLFAYDYSKYGTTANKDGIQEEGWSYVGTAGGSGSGSGIGISTAGNPSDILNNLSGPAIVYVSSSGIGNESPFKEFWNSEV